MKRFNEGKHVLTLNLHEHSKHRCLTQPLPPLHLSVYMSFFNPLIILTCAFDFIQNNWSEEQSLSVYVAILIHAGRMHRTRENVRL